MSVARVWLFKPLLLVSATIAFSCGTGGQPRPSNVPVAAVLSPGPKSTGVWQHCELASQGQVHCRIYNRNGLLLYDEAFVIYSGSMPISQTELTLSSDSGVQWIRLTNGTILIPRSDEVMMKEFLDWHFGKTSHR